MIMIEDVIIVSRSALSCFHYLADLRTTLEWHPNVSAVTKQRPGSIGQGTSFEMQYDRGYRKIKINYVVENYNPGHWLSFRSQNSLLDINEEIKFEEMNGKHTRLMFKTTVSSQHKLKMVRGKWEVLFSRQRKEGFKRLEVALADDNPEPETSIGTTKMDGRLVTALLCFTRLGYTRGQRNWMPMSTDITGKHVVLSGATSGLGYATAISLLEAGANLTLVIRDRKKIRSLCENLMRETGKKVSNIEIANLALLSEVNSLSDRLLDQGRPIDVLINNAGALFARFDTTSEGLEQSVALLLFSPWRLTENLKPLLTIGKSPGRVINVVSGGMYTQRLDVDSLVMLPGAYNGAIAYARAKRALATLTEICAQNWSHENIVINSMHPGWADTPGVQNALPKFRKITKHLLRSSQQGSDTIVWLSRAREAANFSGRFFLDREARATHLLERTRETAADRERLINWLNKTYTEVIERTGK